MSDDVAIVGLGIHPFGRHPGVSGLEMAAHRRARARSPTPASAGRTSTSPPAARTPAGNADTTVSVLGLTGVPFINVKNGCATGGSALTTAHAMLAAGAAEVALVVGFDKHPPGAFNPLPEEWGIGSWYGETGLMLTTQFFAMKIQRYMAEHGDQRVDARQGRRARPSGTARATRTRGGASRSPRRRCSASKMVNDPLTPVHVLLARRGRRRARARARRARRGSSRARRSTCARSRSARGASAPSRSSARRSRSSRRRRRRPRRPRPRSSRPGIGPDDVDVAQLQDTESGAEVMHLAETGLCEHGEQEAADPERRDARSAAACRSTPTAAASPTASRSAPPGCARCTRSCSSCAARPATARSPGPRRVGFTQVYGAPGVSACTVLTR